MKVIDAFCFFNELDLLEFRLKLLGDKVDKFVICESNLTHSGKPKPYHLEENMSRYDRWKDKIVYLPIEQSTENIVFEKVETYTPTDGAWMLENQQRNALSYANEFIEDDDLVLLGDLDEMPNPSAIDALINSSIPDSPDKAVALTVFFHCYYMNCQMHGRDRLWNATVASSGKFFKGTTPQYIRDNRNHFPRIPNAGWHFSYLGGIDKIKIKIESFAHTEFNRPHIASKDVIISAVEEAKDILQRDNIWYEYVPVGQYPEPLRSLMLEYPQFIKNVVKKLA